MSPPIASQHPTAAAVWVVLTALCASVGCSSPGDKGERLSIARDTSLVVNLDGHLVPGDYLRAPVGQDGLDGVIVLRGAQGVTLDLTGVRLRGTPADTHLDQNLGFGIVIEDCRDVTVRGGELGGYKVCVAVRGSTGVVLEDMTFDGWFGQHLGSTPAAEDAADWLRPHENDQDEWISKYGAAISFTDCSRVTVRRCRGRHGQNGVLLTRTDASSIYDNDFSFLSGWGLGMYRSSGNVISHNIFDYCVRGYSHGVYARGQDSAGILMFERCCDNVVAFNSATHGGDGVFLFAGRDLVEALARERGEEHPGGSDRNLFYGNDLRYSPANALEATFSSGNLVVENRLSGCAQHGIWAGYSNRMLVLRNEIHGAQGGGVTIEHGQECVIAENHFDGNNRAVELYWDPDPQLVGGPFGRFNDTSSRDHWLVANVFGENAQDVVLKITTGTTFVDNDWGTSQRPPYIQDVTSEGDPELDIETVRGWMADRHGALPTGHMAQATLRPYIGRWPDLLDEHHRISAPQVPGTQVVGAEERGVSSGDRSTIVMGEWGPWDHRSGEPRPEERRVGGLLADHRWSATWFRWGEDVDPRADLEAWRKLAENPVLSKRVGAWMHPWGDDAVRAAVGVSHFGLIASTRLELGPGRYLLSVRSDDGVRVMVDGEVIFEDWTWHAPRMGTSVFEIEAGRHEMSLEYFQIDGAAALVLEVTLAR